jgi:hypothetical protein
LQRVRLRARALGRVRAVAGRLCRLQWVLLIILFDEQEKKKKKKKKKPRTSEMHDAWSDRSAARPHRAASDSTARTRSLMMSARSRPGACPPMAATMPSTSSSVKKNFESIPSFSLIFLTGVFSPQSHQIYDIHCIPPEYGAARLGVPDKNHPCNFEALGKKNQKKKKSKKSKKRLA